MKLELQLMQTTTKKRRERGVPRGDANTVNEAIAMMLDALKKGRGAWGAGRRVRVLDEEMLATAEETLTNAKRLLGGAS